MNDDVTPTRRHVVTAGAAATLGIATAALAACSGPSSGTAASSSPAASGGTGGSTATSSSASSSGASGGASGSAGGSPTVKLPNPGSSATASGPLAKLSAVPVGGAISAKGTDGTPIIIAQPKAGTVVAFSAICTHQGCTVVPAGQKLLCPCHNSTFDAATGKVLRGLAPSALPSVAVKVDGGNIVAG